MASAHAKFTGELGACLATSGPGACHLRTGLYEARLDHMPMLAIVGQQARTAVGAHYQQELDLTAMFKDEGIFVDDPGQLGDAWERALNAGIPCVLEVKTDPEVPPLPPHITFDQAKAFMSTVLKGGSSEAGMIKGSAKQVLSGVFTKD